jgi:hypothetical protein
LAACDSSASENVIEEEAVVNTNGVRFHTAGNHFVINWQTAGGWTGCRLLQLRLNDGSEHTAMFMFR